MAAAGGDDPFEPLSPGANCLKNVEREDAWNAESKEVLESCLPGQAVCAQPFHSTEEVAETSATGDCSLKSNKDPDAPLQVTHGGERKPGDSGSCGFWGGKSTLLLHTHWGEEKLGNSDLDNQTVGRNGILKTSHCSKREPQNPGSMNLSTDCFGSPDAFSLSHWGEFDTETPVGNNDNGSTKPPCWSNRKSGPVVTRDGIPCSVALSGVELSHREGGKPNRTIEEDDPAVLAMFQAVASSRLAVRSQQKDEPDFTPAQKLVILQDLYRSKPLVFLERFRTALREEHLPCFHHLSGSYEADFYCEEVRKASLGRTRHTCVRNKRYAALQQLIRGGEYFSDEQMRSRDPLLYEQYIGQYLDDDEIQALGGCKLETSCSLSGVLLDTYQEQIIQRRLQIQQEEEEACQQEEEEDDGDDPADKVLDVDMDWVPDQGEKAYLREEFTSRMYQCFLDGKDRDFNYNEVDENPDFDNLDIVSRDEEERYFDGEEPEDADSMEAE